MRHDFWGRSIGGLMLIAVGVLFLLNQTGAIDVDLAYIFSNFWPVILIVIGLKGFLEQRKFDHGWGGSLWSLILIAVGFVFLNNNLGWFGYISFADLFKFTLPAILILLGLNMLFRPQRRHKPREWEPYGKMDGGAGYSGEAGGHEHAYGPEKSGKKAGWHTPHAEADDWKSGWKHWAHSGCASDGVQQKHNLFGDLCIGHDYWELKPMNISHFIGDTELDLTKAHIPYGETKINISAFIGDVKVLVPNDIQLEVSVSASSFLGDISVFDRWEGGLFRNMKAESPHYHEAEKRLKINVSMFIGDLRVKRVG